RGPAEGARRAALDAVLPAAQPERGLFGGADGEGRGDVHDRQGAVPGRADAADVGRPGRGDAISGIGPEAAGDAAPSRALPGAAGVAVLAAVMAVRAEARQHTIWLSTRAT